VTTKINVDGLFVYLPGRQDRSQPFTEELVRQGGGKSHLLL